MLKTKRMFVTLLISAMFLIGGAFTALAAAPDGSFDAYHCRLGVGFLHAEHRRSGQRNHYQ